MDSSVVLPVLLVVLVLAIVMMFAQVRLFSIDRTLKEIKADLAAANKKAEKPTYNSLNPLSIK